MPATAVNPTSSAAALAGLTQTKRQDRGIGALKSEDFFKILVTELQQQDPLNPAETSDMIGNVSQIRSIELSSQLSDTLDSLVKQQRTAGTTDMIGKYIVAFSANEAGEAQPVEGVVSSVYFGSDGSAVLELDTGQAVRAADVSQMTTPEEAERILAQTGATTLADAMLSGATLNNASETGSTATAKSLQERAAHKTANFMKKLFHL